jgi:phosphotransferase system  glucose/maltose/N-acetylglucosamine-specific IIC component
MEANRRGLVIVVFALSIAGLLMAEDVINQRSVEEYNRSQSREKMTYDGGWIAEAACWLALAIAVIEGHALMIAMRRERTGRKAAP